MLKFGGTSVASRKRWEVIASRARELLEQGLRVWIVVSAVTKVTNALLAAIEDAIDAPFSASEAPSSLYSASTVSRAAAGGNSGTPTAMARDGSVESVPGAAERGNARMIARVTSMTSVTPSEGDEEDPAVTARLKEYHFIAACHEALGGDLGLNDEEMAPVRRLLGELRRLLEGVHLSKEASPRVRARVTAFGELLSSHLGKAFLRRALSGVGSPQSPGGSGGEGPGSATVRRVDARSLLVSAEDDAAEAAPESAGAHDAAAGGGPGGWPGPGNNGPGGGASEPGIGLDVDIDAELAAADAGGSGSVAGGHGSSPGSGQRAAEADENPAAGIVARSTLLARSLAGGRALALEAADEALFDGWGDAQAGCGGAGAAERAPSGGSAAGGSGGAGGLGGACNPARRSRGRAGAGQAAFTARSDEDHFLRAEVAPVIARELCEEAAGGADVVITQGFIASTADEGATCLLGRGGSDTSGGLFACMLRAVRLEIWTDVHGMFTADPRQIPEARLLQRLSYREAQELAAMGAKVLHPRCLVPAAVARVPVEIRNTADRHAPAEAITRIEAAGASKHPEVLAVARREGVALVTVSTVGMWGAVGFVAGVFNACAALGCSVDLIATSQYAISLTFDHIPGGPHGPVFRRLLSTLSHTAHVELVYPCAVVSVVGRRLRSALPKLGPALRELRSVECHMISEAAEDLNMSFVVPQAQADALLARLHRRLFGGQSGADEADGEEAAWAESLDSVGPGQVASRALGPTWAELTVRAAEIKRAAAIAAGELESVPPAPPVQPEPAAAAAAEASPAASPTPVAAAPPAAEPLAAPVPGLGVENAWFLQPALRAALLAQAAAGFGSGSPVPAAFVYHLPTAQGRARSMAAAMARAVAGSPVRPRVLHALKANDCAAVVAALVAGGAGGVECVSLGEVAAALALRAELGAELLVQYTPNFAAGDEMAEALRLLRAEPAARGGFSLVLDGAEAAEALLEGVAASGAAAGALPVGLRVDLGAEALWGGGEAPTHHDKVTTVGPGQKFGCPVHDLGAAVAACAAAGLVVEGLHCHAGSGVLTRPDLWARVARALAAAAVRCGLAPSLQWLDVGGGMGVVERPDSLPLDLAAMGAELAAALADSVTAALPALRELRVEPGRYCTAPAGILMCQVTQVRSKRAGPEADSEATFVGVSAGMNSLVRPAMYGSRHEAFSLALSESLSTVATTGAVHVVGPICESADMLCPDARFVSPTIRKGEWIAIANAGAYGAVMASSYNRRAPAVEATMADNGTVTLQPPRWAP